MEPAYQTACTAEEIFKISQRNQYDFETALYTYKQVYQCVQYFFGTSATFRFACVQFTPHNS